MSSWAQQARLLWSVLLISGGLLVLPQPCVCESSDGIVAIVNDDVVTEGEVASRMSALLDQHDVPPEAVRDTAEVRRAVIQRLIDERLVLQEAKRLNLSVSAEEIADRLRGLRERLGEPQAFRQMLEEAGLTEEQLKVKLRDQTLAQKAMDQVIRPKIVVSPMELSKAVQGSPEQPAAQADEEVRAYHLLIRVNDQRSTEQARVLINQLYAQLLRGASFEELAGQYSEDPNGPQGGLMGWARKGDLLPELDVALFGLPPGELSSPIQTRLGFHLVRVVERRGASAEADPRQAAERRLYQEKFTVELNRWIQDLRQHAYVELTNE